MVQEGGWTTGPVWTSAGNLAPHWGANSGPSSPLHSRYMDYAIPARVIIIIIIIAYLHIYFHRAFKSPGKETCNNNLRTRGATPPNPYVFVGNSPNNLNRQGHFSFFVVIWQMYWAFHVKYIAQPEIHYITKQE